MHPYQNLHIVYVVLDEERDAPAITLRTVHFPKTSKVVPKTSAWAQQM